MARVIRLTFLLALFAGVVAMAIRPEPAPRKRLIEFGWDSPDPHFMRTHIAELQASPFDGCVFHVPYFEPGGRTGDFTWELWGRRRFTRAELDSARRDLLATRFGRFRDNFLRVNTTPGNLDWFEDHSAVLSNLELAASLAREAGAPGVLLDPEQYQGQLWDYSVQRRATGRNWDQLAAQVRRRGAEVMRALERGYPGLTVFMTFAYSLPLHETIGGRGALTGAHNGLLAPFLDGMLEAARDSTRIVDGHELSYSYRDPARFAAQADSMRRGCSAWSRTRHATGGGCPWGSASGWTSTRRVRPGNPRRCRGTTSHPSPSGAPCRRHWTTRTNTCGSTEKSRAGGPCRAGPRTCPRPTTRCCARYGAERPAPPVSRPLTLSGVLRHTPRPEVPRDGAPR